MTGQDLAVEYYLPDRSSIQNVFRLPAPSVSVFQDNAGTPAESGNYRFTIAYSNWGDGPAENVVKIG